MLSVSRIEYLFEVLKLPCSFSVFILRGSNFSQLIECSLSFFFEIIIMKVRFSFQSLELNEDTLTQIKHSLLLMNVIQQNFIIKMSTVGLSQTTNIVRQSLSQQKTNRLNVRQSARQKALLKQVNLLSQGVKIRDSQILTLKGIINSLKNQGKNHKTALTTESDYDPIDRAETQLSSFPLSSTIETYREQLEIMKQKYSQSCNTIAELEAKLKTALNISKNKEQQLKNQIQLLKEDLKYLKDEHARSIDCLNIQMQHRQAQRIKIVQNRQKHQMQILNEQISTLRKDNSEKLLEIARLNEKIKKQRANNDANVKFIQKQNAQLRDKIEKISIQLKQDFRKRQQGLIAQFQVDLQLLHKQQAGQIKILCDRIRVLKSLLEEKDCQLKQLWKARSTQAQTLFATRPEIIKPKLKTSEDLQLSVIDKYLKHSQQIKI